MGFETGLRESTIGKKGLLKSWTDFRFRKVDNCMHAVTNFFNHIHSSILDVKDRVRLLNDSQIPSDVLPLISRMIRRLVELLKLRRCPKVELQDGVFNLTYMVLQKLLNKKTKTQFIGLKRGKAKQIIQMKCSIGCLKSSKNCLVRILLW